VGTDISRNSLTDWEEHTVGSTIGKQSSLTPKLTISLPTAFPRDQ
jgi:hypothetical protein